MLARVPIGCWFSLLAVTFHSFRDLVVVWALLTSENTKQIDLIFEHNKFTIFIPLTLIIRTLSQGPHKCPYSLGIPASCSNLHTFRKLAMRHLSGHCFCREFRGSSEARSCANLLSFADDPISVVYGEFATCELLMFNGHSQPSNSTLAAMQISRYRRKFSTVFF